MKRNIISLVVACLVLAGAAFGLSQEWGQEGSTYYSGCVVLPTEEDYVDFKLAFVEGEVVLIKAEILASEPPIIVTFKAQVSSYACEFPYGEKSISGYFNKGAGGLAAFTFFCFCGLLVGFLPVLFISKWCSKWRKD